MEIPGYKWDPEKNRYFKVLKTGQLPGGNYTVASVAEKERQFRRGLASRHAKELSEASQQPALPESEFEFHRLGFSSQTVYVGSSDELLSAICVTEDGRLATGSRNGVLAFGGRKSGKGRSIVALSEAGPTFVAAAVDNEFGSFWSTPEASCELRNEYATSLCTMDRSLATGTQHGVSLWDIEQSTKLGSRPVGSVSALTSRSSHEALVGTKAGALQILDTRTSKASKLRGFENRKSITNLGLAGETSLVATGLEDEMWLYDLRYPREPVLQFAEYENWSTAKHGFAVRDNTVAVALDNGDVRVYDVVTGQSLGCVYLPASQDPVPALAWTPAGLYVATQNTVLLKPGNQANEVVTGAEGVVARIHSRLNRRASQ